MTRALARTLAVLLASLWLAPAAARAQSKDAPRGPLKDVSIEQRLNQPLPLDLAFRDETGRRIELSSYFHDKPVVLAFVYYRCPMLCSYVVHGVLRAMRAMTLSAGKDFELVIVSFDPSDTPPIAKVKKDDFLKDYRRPGAADAIHFLTGDPPQIAALTKAAGFQYARDPETGQFAHAAGIMVATPGGRLSRYFYGVEYAPRDMRFALVDASKGTVGTPVDKVLLYCFHYDPTTGKYSLVVLRLVRLGGLLTVLVLGGVIFAMSRVDGRSRRGRGKS
jgi:protein SCO1/2